MTRLNWGVLSARFRSNEVRLRLSLIASNLRNLWPVAVGVSWAAAGAPEWRFVRKI